MWSRPAFKPVLENFKINGHSSVLSTYLFISLVTIFMNTTHIMFCKVRNNYSFWLWFLNIVTSDPVANKYRYRTRLFNPACFIYCSSVSGNWELNWDFAIPNQVMFKIFVCLWSTTILVFLITLFLMKKKRRLFNKNTIVYLVYLLDVGP